MPAKVLRCRSACTPRAADGRCPTGSAKRVALAPQSRLVQPDGGCSPDEVERCGCRLRPDGRAFRASGFVVKCPIIDGGGAGSRLNSLAALIEPLWEVIHEQP